MKRKLAIKYGRQLRGLGKTLDDEQVALAPFLVEEWVQDHDYVVGDRRRVGDVIFKCKQGHHAPADPNYAPDKYTAGWDPIPNPDEDGTLENPYTWVVGMELFNGKYYRDAGVLYICTRDSGIGMSFSLASLVGQYVEVVE